MNPFSPPDINFILDYPMESITIFKSAPIFLFLWGAAIALLLFRPYLSAVWKLLPLLLFLFYLWFFHQEFLSTYTALKVNFAATIIAFLKDLLIALFYILFLLWPVGIVFAFYSADEVTSEFIIKFLIALTLVVWLAMTVSIITGNKLDNELLKKLFSIFPFRK